MSNTLTAAVREKVKTVAVAMVRESGLINLSRRALCERAGVPDGSFPHIMGCNFVEFVDELSRENLEPVTLHPVNKARANPRLRKDHILAAAVELSRRSNYRDVTREAVAELAGVSPGLVSRYFSTMKQLRRDVMRYAARENQADIIAQGLAAGDDHARKAPPELRDQAREIINATF